MTRSAASLLLIAVASCATAPPPEMGFAPFCTTTGALGRTFGPDPDYDGEPRLLDYEQDPTIAPFHSLDIARSRLSGVTHTISGYTLVYAGGDVPADLAAAERAFNDFRARVEASGAFHLRQEGQYSADYFAAPVRGSPPLRLTLSHSGSRVLMTCTRPDLFRIAWREMPDDVRAQAEEALRRLREREAPEGFPQ